MFVLAVGASKARRRRVIRAMDAAGDTANSSRPKFSLAGMIELLVPQRSPVCWMIG
jgi:hypothetical protein